MDCLKSRRYDSMIYMGPARTGKTVSVVDGWMMDIAARNPADTLLVQISQDKAAEFSKKRLERSMLASPEVRAAMSPRSSDNNIHDIKLKNGTFFKIGWPSKTIFASSDWCNVILTDYDRMALDIGGEGSGFLLAGKRTQTFMSRGMVLAESSPGRPVSDPGYRVANAHEAPPAPGIASLYNMGDRRLFMWQCPDCDEWFEGDFDLLNYDKDEADPSRASADVFMVCPHCGAMHREGNRVDGQPFKHWANNRGVWLPDGCLLEPSGRMIGEARPTRSASFWQKGPSAAFQTWEQLVYKLVAAKKDYDTTGDVTALQTTVNVDQG
ncbi:MAG: terminase gpA endonuclease subunit, partial [Aeromonas veronii]